MDWGTTKVCVDVQVLPPPALKNWWNPVCLPRNRNYKGMREDKDKALSSSLFEKKWTLRGLNIFSYSSNFKLHNRPPHSTVRFHLLSSRSLFCLNENLCFKYFEPPQLPHGLDSWTNTHNAYFWKYFDSYCVWR